MQKNCLLVISKNEGLNPISIAEKAIESDIVDKVIISDGSNQEAFEQLKKRQTQKIEVISEKKHVQTNEIGKGIGMINGGMEAIKQGFENIAYIDGDICSPDISKWFEYLFNPLEENIDLVKVSFSRNPADGQITRHIIKPLIAMFLPNAWEIEQPIGGELAIKKDALKEIFSIGIQPPYGWGIDNFITMKSLIFGYTIGEVYLGQKMHNAKTLTNLKKMFTECFQEAVSIINYFYNLPYRKKIKPIIKIPSPYQNNQSFDNSYMDIRQEVERSLDVFKMLKRMYLPHDDLFYQIKGVDDFDSFYKKTQPINIDVWVEILYWFVKKFNQDIMDQYYLRWKIRALSFCLHEINTIEQAESRTTFQAKSALDFIDKIGERAHMEDPTQKVYFYKKHKK